MTEPSIRRFIAKVLKNNRITIPKEHVSIYQMQHGETWLFEIVQRVNVPKEAPTE